jgi:multidrug efflux pump subunit AcrA (membrane-fusion protein)
MARRSGAPWFVYALAALLVGAIAVAILIVGPDSSGAVSAATRTITAQRGVVQSTVSGSGNIEAASQLNLGFKTSGTVTQIDATQGEDVAQGQLLATLDPQSAEVTLEAARASLQSAEASLVREEETNGEPSGQSTSGERSTSAAAGVASTATGGTSEPTSSKGTGGGSRSQGTSAGSTSTGTGQASTSTGTSGGSTLSAATREANIASAKATVRSDRLTVKSDEQSVADTRLVAPEDGTIVSLSGEVGETVSGGGTSRASSSATGSSASGSSGAEGSGKGSAAAGAGSGSGSGASGSSSASSSSLSASAFAVLSDLSTMKLVVPLSESEVGSVRRGQPATVTVEALKGVKLAAHVSEVAELPTSNSGVVSYDVTFELDQLETGVKAGMSASAEVVVAQAEGVNVPTSAISGGSVTVIRSGKQARQPVTTGLAGNSSTVVLSGLQAGERVVLPLSSASGTSSLLSRLAGRGGALGGGGLGGGAGLGGGGFARRALGAGPGG